MKTVVKNALMTFGILCATSTAFAGGGQIGSAGGSQRLVGRLIESSCNRAAGIADIKAAVINPETNEMNYLELNLVNDQLCIKGSSGFQPIVNMVLYSSADILSSEDENKSLRLHEITVNQNGIATNVKTITVDGELAKIYRQLKSKNLNSYPNLDKRLFSVDEMIYGPQATTDRRTEELINQIRQMAE